MTDQQWNTLLGIIAGEKINPLPAGFIIDSPWLPNWARISILDYFTSDEKWLQANKKALETFPDVMFFPGFWSEYGMCSEPSAFGARCRFPANEFPHAFPTVKSVEEIDQLKKPRPETDGLGPFILNRLKLNEKKMNDLGHKIRFSVSRGPLNIASFLMGSSEFLMAMMMDPDRVHAFLRIITDYLADWHKLQRDIFPTIEGMLLLDDIIGFMSKEDFKLFGLPFFKELYSVNLPVKFLHNDAPCRASAPFLNEMGVNLFNMGYDVSLSELKILTENKITLLGNLPPRDVLAQKSAGEINEETRRMLNGLEDHTRFIPSCGGGMPPGVSTGNINAFVQALANYS